MSISTIRTLIQDNPLWAKEEILVLGDQTRMQLKFFPAIEGTVIITDGDGDAIIAFTLEESTGLVVLAAAPGDGIIVVEYKHVSLLDADIQEMIDLNEDADDVNRLAAADCLDAIATSQALIQKKIKLLDLETDGPALAKALREHAKSLRAIAGGEEGGEPYFEIIEQINDGPGLREKIRKDIMRQLP